VDDEADARWHLADLRHADTEPVDLEALIAEMHEKIAAQDVRERVVARLEDRLRQGPAWQGQPQVMFPPEDPIAKGLGWRGPAMTEPIYDILLAPFLANLACSDQAQPAVAKGLARRATESEDFGGEPDRLLTQLLAQRLTPDRPEDCPAAAELPEDLRTKLEELASRLDQRSPDATTGAAYPPPTALRPSEP
jgi:hypothetical protein